jgi:hypothetical protein
MVGMPTLAAWQRLRARLLDHARQHKCEPLAPPEIPPSPRGHWSIWRHTVEWAERNGCVDEVEKLQDCDFPVDGTVPQGQMRPDPCNDDIGQVLRKILEVKNWNNAKRALAAELDRLLKDNRYTIFDGKPSRFHISRRGESYLYDVPAGKRGVLAKYRGRRIRLLCRSSLTYGCSFAAGVVKE